MAQGWAVAAATIYASGRAELGRADRESTNGGSALPALKEEARFVGGKGGVGSSPRAFAGRNGRVSGCGDCVHGCVMFIIHFTTSCRG